ncbi:hypothetical protein M409DRAFT_30050 [Zasmidium cellare ATCC 36951]|uniref:Uncharacterized protein n=1 Tax=Zasmidium cellare ATCC 36951 TaxID=1080233 RepID=A0A6A6C0U6_ZASCE|nr:uncharacterized protein M409DRAFT_30050 [Zasmidium cellare ATCC 36951]KAF2159432.1 hypothetical protein M409DRAFT_30050 [Zasmidium cellare ATCC 36951]
MATSSDLTNGKNGHGPESEEVTDQKVAIVTGATSGMGIDLARHLHSKNYRVALVGRNKEAGNRIATTITTPEVQARFFQADVSSYQYQAEMFKAVWDTWGRIDLLCANAGIIDQSSLYLYNWRGKGVEEVPPEPDLSCTDVDYKGVVYGTVLTTHFMRHNPTPGGRIILNASIGGIFPHKSYPEYCGAKAAAIHFVRGVAPLLKQKENILINTVLPGMVQTPIVPMEMMEAVSPECVTPISTILRAHDTFVDDETGMFGKSLEASAEDLRWYNLPEPGNGYKTLRAVTVWEPLFKAMHGEESGLEDAIP